MEEGVKGRHAVEAVVVSCMDFRLYSGDLSANLFRAIRETFAIGDFDILTTAGGAKNTAALLEDIGLALEKHHAKKVILLNHENCGKYASEGIVFSVEEKEKEKEFHAKELANAAKIVKERFPGADVITGYAVFKNDNSISIT